MFSFLHQHLFVSRTIIRNTLMLILAAWVGTAHPAIIIATEAEMQLLPRYCPYTKWFDTPAGYFNERAKYWRNLMGSDGFQHMHHHCWGLLKMARSQKANLSKLERTGLRESALGDYMYVISKSPPNFIMLPEVYTKAGSVELLLQNPNKANENFARARQQKPDYWPAYSLWAEYLMKIGKRAEALEIVTSGLQKSPGVKVLLEQYRTLGGKPSDIPAGPVKKAEQAVDSSTEVKLSEQQPSSTHETAPITEVPTLHEKQ